MATLLCLLTLAAPRASADLVFDLSAGNSAISGFSGPYAQVDVHLILPTEASITFTSLTNSGNIYLMGADGAVAVNVNATAFVGSCCAEGNAGTGFTLGPISLGGAGNEDGFGSFNLTLNSFDGFTHSSDTIIFGVFNTGGTWASAADVLTPNGDGNDAAAHILVTTAPANAANGALATGFASQSAPVTTPEPSSFVLLLTGPVGFAGATRRKLLA